MPGFENRLSEHALADQEKLNGILKSLHKLYQDLECAQNGQTLTVEDIDREHRANRFPYGSYAISRAFGGNVLDAFRAAGIPTLTELKVKKETVPEKKFTKDEILQWFTNFFPSTGFAPKIPDVSDAIKNGLLPPAREIKKICGESTVELVKRTEAKIQLSKLRKNPDAKY